MPSQKKPTCWSAFLCSFGTAFFIAARLQDQSFGLDKWMKAGAGDLAERRKEPSPEDIENDEMSTARQAVVEGQAMAVLIDYMLQPTGQSLLSAPSCATSAVSVSRA